MAKKVSVMAKKKVSKKKVVKKSTIEKVSLNPRQKFLARMNQFREDQAAAFRARFPR